MLTELSDGFRAPCQDGSPVDAAGRPIQQDVTHPPALEPVGPGDLALEELDDLAVADELVEARGPLELVGAIATRAAEYVRTVCTFGVFGLIPVVVIVVHARGQHEADAAAGRFAPIAPITKDPVKKPHHAPPNYSYIPSSLPSL